MGRSTLFRLKVIYSKHALVKTYGIPVLDGAGLVYAPEKDTRLLRASDEAKFAEQNAKRRIYTIRSVSITNSFKRSWLRKLMPW
jgi:hypothetical protein